MTSFLDCWSEIASTLFAEALAGGAELLESFPHPFDAGPLCFEARLDGELQGRFSVTLDGAVLDAPLLGEGRDQKPAWGELLRELACAAAGELLARTRRSCRVVSFEPCHEDIVALALERMSGLRVESGVVQESEFLLAHERMLKTAYPQAQLLEASSEQALGRALARVIERARPVESRLVRVHDCLWLRLWKKVQTGPVPELDSVEDVIGSVGD